jgi:hypothetical protein
MVLKMDPFYLEFRVNLPTPKGNLYHTPIRLLGTRKQIWGRGNKRGQ